MGTTQNGSLSAWPEYEEQAEKDELNTRCGYGPAWENDLSWLHWWENYERVKVARSQG